tara:strand:+ start:4300 stop:5490 length:1191 start_codon:yes stop_codon:yes gene_type:complete
MKHLLITQQELCNYGGSEVVTLELANQAFEAGFKVTILTNRYSPPFIDEFSDRITITADEDQITLSEISHLWIHHNYYPEKLLSRIEKTGSVGDIKIAFHHMSPYVPIESPFLPTLESSIADYVYFNSQETLESYNDLFADKEKLRVFGNPAPDKFDFTKKPTDSLSNILVVSNHVPEELRIALKEMKNVKVRYIGESDQVTLVQPSDIEAADVVVSIGKTVQYSMLSATPVYCYDHFGGPGYITLKNYKKAKSYNFSGRGYSKKSPADIKKELIEQFAFASKQAQAIKHEYIDGIKLSNALNEFLNAKSKKKTLSIRASDIHKARIQSQLNRTVVQSFGYYKEQIQNKDSQLEFERTKNTKLKDQYKDVKHRYENTIEYQAKRVAKKILKSIKVI